MTVSDPEVRVDLALKESGCWAMFIVGSSGAGARGGCCGTSARVQMSEKSVSGRAEIMRGRREKRVHGPASATAIAPTVTEALEEGEAGGLRERSTGHGVILCCGVGSWEGVGMRSG